MKLNNFNNQNKINNGLKSILIFLLSLSFWGLLSCDLLDTKEEQKETEENHFEESLEEAIHHLKEDSPTAKTAGNHFTNAVELTKAHTPYQVTLASNTNGSYSGYCKFEASGEEALFVFTNTMEYAVYESNQSTQVESEKSGEKNGYHYSVFELKEHAEYYLYLTANTNTVLLVKEYLEEGHNH